MMTENVFLIADVKATDGQQGKMWWGESEKKDHGSIIYLFFIVCGFLCNYLYKYRKSLGVLKEGGYRSSK